MSISTEAREWIYTKEPENAQDVSAWTERRSPLPDLKENQVLVETVERASCFFHGMICYY